MQYAINMHANKQLVNTENTCNLLAFLFMFSLLQVTLVYNQKYEYRQTLLILGHW